MNRPENNYSRSKRKKKSNRTNTIINILLGIVVVLIVITASMIFFGGNSNNKANQNKKQEIEEPKEETKEETNENNENNEKNNEKEPDKEDVNEDGEDLSKEEESNEDEGSEESGVLINKSPDDDYVKETILHTGWEPIGTKQQGDHVSLYDGTSDDWHEKIEAISYATGLSKDDMRIWKIGNGGNSQKSIGIVSSKSNDEKYRVYLDWVDDEGWLPVKMDILKTLDFNFDK